MKKETQKNKVEYKYIIDAEFSKMKRSERMAMKQLYPKDDIEITRLVLVPTTRKSSGYCVGAFFAKTKSGWCRLGDYDCWRIITDINNPVAIRYSLLRGDFENGGVCFFGFADENRDVKIVARCGGEIVVTKK